MYRMSDEEFERAIEEALDAMPDQFIQALENVAIVWEDEPNAYHLGYDEEEWDAEGPDGQWAGGEEWDEDADGQWGGEGSEEAWGDNAEGFAEDDGYDDILGLFDGLSIVERADGYDDDIPNVITVFKGPHERRFSSREEIVEEIGKTVVHELGHYFGLDEEQLAAMGYE